jgi:hypothetical protein
VTQIEIAKTKRLRLTPDFDFDSDFDLEKSKIKNLAMEEEDPQLAEAKSWLEIQRNLRNYLPVKPTEEIY